MNVSVLYISYDGMTDNLGQSQVIPYVIGLQKKGYAIHILSCEKPAAFAAREKHISKLLKKYKIQWHPISYTSKPAVFSTLYDIHRMQKEARTIVQKHAISFVHCRSYIAAQVGVYLAKNFSIPWIFDMRGFWADERIEGGIWDSSKFLYHRIYYYFKQLEKTFVRSASHIVSLTQAGKQEIEQWTIYKTYKTPIHVIPCCADLQLFSPTAVSERKKQKLRNELHITKKQFVLSYLGSFGTWYMTEEMFDFFKVLHSFDSDAIFLCITADEKDTIEQIARNKDIPLDSLRVVAANREDVPAYASLSHWSIFFILPVYSKKASSPTKMGELLGLGIPLICNDGVGDVSAIMQKCVQGKVITTHNQQEYARVAQEVLKDTADYKNELHATACDFYSLDMGIELYASLYKDLAEKTKQS